MGPRRQKRSLAWNHFILMEGKDDSAQCKKCGVVLRVTKGSTSGLLKHLRVAHGFNGSRRRSELTDPLRDLEDEDVEFSDKDEEDDRVEFKEEPEESQQEEDDRSEDGGKGPVYRRPRKSVSLAWKYFIRMGASGQEARCRLCQTVLKTAGGNTSGLIRHMASHKIKIRRQKRKPRGGHLPLEEKEEEEDLQEGAEVMITEPAPRRRKLRSSVWQHFIPMRDGRGTFKCKSCGLLVKSKIGTSALAKHLQRDHGGRKKEKIFQRVEEWADDGPRPTRALTSTVWKHFVPLVYRETARCRKCQKVLSTKGGNTSGLGRHLDSVHGISFEGWDGSKPAVQVKQEVLEEEWEEEMEDSLSVEEVIADKEETFDTCFACHTKFDSRTLPKFGMKEYRWLLMELLEIPAGDSLDYLERLERPERWLALCGPCQGVVGEGLSLRKEINRLERKLEKCQGTFLRRIKKQTGGDINRGGDCPEEKREVLKKVRTFVGKRNYAVLEEDEADINVEEVLPEGPSSPLGGDRNADLEPGPQTVRNYSPPPSPLRRTASSSTKLVKGSRIFLSQRQIGSSQLQIRKRPLRPNILSPVEQCRKYLYDCPSCPGVKQYSLTKFAMHLVLHKRRPYQCSICSEFLSADQHLREQHWLEKHPNLLLTPEPERFLDVSCQPGKYWKCDGYSCPAQYSTEEERDEHGLTCLFHPPPAVKPYSCNLCEEVKFRNIPEWRIHRALSHPEVDRISCYFCNETFLETTVEGLEIRHDSRMRQHMGQVHGASLLHEECEPCGIVYDTVAERKEHLLGRHQLSPDQLDLCSICHSKNFDLNGLRRHISHIHFQRSSSVCEICGEKYLQPEAFIHHKYVSHGLVPEGSKVEQCPEPGCGFKSVVGKKVSKHFREVHEAERHRQFVCPTCGKSFKTLSHLKYHSEIHVNEGSKQFQCDICGSAFAVKMYLSIHKKKKHGLGGGRAGQGQKRFRDRDKSSVFLNL